MKKLIYSALALVMMFSGITGLVEAKNENSENNHEIKANTGNVPSESLKQQLLIEETGKGNMVLIKGATITEISFFPGATGTATGTATGSSSLDMLKVKIFGQDYKIHVLAGSNVVKYDWGKLLIDLSEFSIGDIVNVYGTLDASDTFLVHAKTIRNVSLQKKHAVLEGSIKNINASDTSFTLATKKAGDQTVNVGSSTNIYQKKTLKAFSDLKEGMKVQVRGILNKTLSKIQALLINIKAPKE